MAKEPYKIGLAGLGTVGLGVVRMLEANGATIAQRAGRPVEIKAVSARNRSKDRGVDLSGCDWVDDPKDLAIADVDCVVEVMGGEGDPALSLTHNALKQKKDVVTANKALLAHYGFDLAVLAENNGVSLAYEAAIAGGIPIVKSLREGFAGNLIDSVEGILNGTSNFILSEMRARGEGFKSVLKDAQDKGYAEADPTYDVDGVDAAHKLTLLSALAFGIKPDFERVRIKGIRAITSFDIAFATELGFRIKLLGVARRKNGKIIQVVEPCLIGKDDSLAHIDGALNAVLVKGDFLEESMSVGWGAGQGPTASSIISDIVDLARGEGRPMFGIPAVMLTEAEWLPPGDLTGQFYLRLNVLDQPGVVAEVSSILRDHDISIEAFIQRGRDPGQPVPLVITTHEASQKQIAKACDLMTNIPAVIEPPCLMRIEGA